MIGLNKIDLIDPKRPYIQFILYLFGSFILFTIFFYKESGCIIPYLNKEGICLLKKLKKEAYQGDLSFQKYLAQKYYIQNNYSKALKWYKKAMKHGSAEIYYQMGNMFLNLKNRKQIFKKDTIHELTNWYKDQAKKGDNLAQKILIDMYCADIFSENELFKKWYKKWKKKGWTTITCLLKEKGITTPKNKEKKLDLYKELAIKGYIQAQYELGYLFFEEEKKIEAIKWYKKAASKGQPEAQYELGLLLIKENQIEEGLKWLNKSDLHWKSPKTRYIIALTIEDANSKYYNALNKNLQKEVFKWYKKAVFFKDSKAEYYLANCYIFGEGVDKDIEIALELYKESAKKGYEPSIKALTEIYAGKEKYNPEKVIKWYKKLVALHSSFKCHICHLSEFIIKKMGFSFFINNLKAIYEF